MAYFELKDLEKEMPREDVEKFVRQAGGLKSLIDCLHGITAMQKKKDKKVQKPVSSTTGTQRERPFPVPEGLPKTQEELDDEERGRMPDSPFTRLLRSMGRLPAWFSQAPDHETD